MLARINSADTAADQLAGLVQFSEDQLPAAREAPGFEGFYLLADRQSGKVVSISLWTSEDDLWLFEGQGTELRQEASSELGIAPTLASVYEVVVRA